MIEDHFSTGGLYSKVCEILARNQKISPLQSISMGERWFKPGLLSEVLEFEGFTGQKLADRIRKEI
jgi:transketolase